MTETSISPKKVLAIMGSEYIAGADYYIRTTDDGAEELWMWGDDEPCATNYTTTSWHSPGYPSLDDDDDE